jgi:hypothetical protein
MPKPGQRYWSLIEPIWLPLNKSWDADPGEFESAFANASPIAADLYAAHWCQSEVCNGGFHQFFYNTTGILAPEAWRAFQRMGADQWAGLLEKAIVFFGEPYPRDRSERLNLLPKSEGRKRVEWDPFHALDKQFYEWLHAEKDRWNRIADAYAEQEIRQ